VKFGLSILIANKLTPFFLRYIFLQISETMIREEKFYNYLKKKRIALGLNQTQLARKLNVAISTLSHAESGDYTRFPLNKVLFLADLLREDPDKFVILWIDAILDNQRISLKNKIYGKQN
tara:strand:+ start:1247 stop:1606 length:360 start_codon:yes stop_codon:yes gene_type:complete